MNIPYDVRQAANAYGGNNLAKVAAFLEGWKFAHPEKLNRENEEAMEKVVQTWLDYKRERRQTYKPRGLAIFRRRLYEMSKGDAETARQIVEQSMMNNYAGIFPLKQPQLHSDGTILRHGQMDVTSGGW